MKLQRTAMVIISGLSLFAQEAPILIPREEEREGRPGGRGQGPDDPKGRSKAMLDWYGGEATPDYRRHLMETAFRERQLHGRHIPGSGLALQTVSGTLWNNIGPTDANSQVQGGNNRDSGRVVSIAVHPTDGNILYIATSGGGLWKTINGGTSWTSLSDAMGTLASGAVTLDPNNPNTVYLGLGNWNTNEGWGGTGLLKSTDGGATWGPTVFLGASMNIREVKVSPQNSNLVLVATNTGVFRSTDGGATFASVSSTEAWSLAWTGGTRWTVSNQAGIKYSNDDGATWSTSTGVGTVLRVTLSNVRGNPGKVWALAETASGCEIYTSNDGGMTYSALGAASKNMTNSGSATTLATVVGTQGWYDQMVLIHPTNANLIIVGGSLSAAVSRDGGSTWANLSDWYGSYNLPFVHADLHSGAWGADGALYLGTDGGLTKSSDSGKTFSTSVNKGVATHLIYNLSCTPAAPDAVLGGLQDNGTRLRVGATSTYNQIFGGDGFGCLIHPKNPSSMLVSYVYTDINKSTDGGANFTAAKSGISGQGPFITKLIGGPADTTGNTAYTFTGSTVYKTTNFASSWSAMGSSGISGTIRNIAAAKSSGQVLGVVTNSGVYITANGGSSWTKGGALPGAAFSPSLSNLWFDTTNYNTVYVCSVALDKSASHLWKSSNLGASWTAIDKNGFPVGIPVNVIQNDPSNSQVLFAGTYLGMYASTDAGSTWTRHGSGLPLVNTTDFYISSDGTLMRAATFGRGLWELQAGSQVSVSLSPAATSLATGATFQFNGAVMGSENAALTWSTTGGTVSTTGFYTAPATAGTYSVKATSVADPTKSASATVTVTQPGSVLVSLTPATVNLVTGGTQAFSAAVTGSPNTSVTWTATGGSITSNGVYTAPATAGTYTVKATSVADPSKSAQATVTVTTVLNPGTEILLNGGFESGAANWAGSTTAIGNWTSSYNQPAFEGVNAAYLGGYGSTVTESLHQTVAIPSDASSATLTFYLHIDTRETGTVANDQLAVQVRDQAGSLLGTLATFSNANAAGGYQLRTLDVSAYKGRTLRLHFNMTENASLATNFLIDKVSLKVSTVATAPTITTQPGDQTVNAGSTATFSVVASGTAPFTYQWHKNGTPIVGATSATYLTPSLTPADNGSLYYVRVANALGAVSSRSLRLTVNSAPPPSNLILNGSFEAGAANWFGTTGAIGNWSSAYQQPAYEGLNSAYLGGSGTTSTETLYQTVTIPATATSATLSFYLHIDTKETGTTPYDKLAIQVRNASGALLATLATYSNAHAATGYQPRSFNLGAYKGQSIRVHFNMVEDSVLATNFLVDKVELNIQ